MKRFLSIILIAFSVVFLVPKMSLAAGVSCPVQPKSQKGTNLLFFSFYKKSANLYSYIPANLVLVDKTYLKAGPRCLTSQSYDAFVSMNSALYLETNTNLVISSAWRSKNTQMYFAKTRGKFAAVPGRSEHQLGTTVDLDVFGAKEEDYFGNSIAYQWMVLHAHEYGFVQSFNIEGETSNGIPNEPWHWRFVGKTIATKVNTDKLNINKYLYDREQTKKALKQ